MKQAGRKSFHASWLISMKNKGGYRVNFVFISPNFPENYWLFCQGLMRLGVHVCGVGDAPYASLSDECKQSLTEYYQVSSLENIDEIIKALETFTKHYGKIDGVESNNEYWLRQDARLREVFHIETGIQLDEIDNIQRKSKMKAAYAKAGIKTARWCLSRDRDELLAFANEVGFPIIAKQDIGVGASNTHKFRQLEEYIAFIDQGFDEEMIFEEFIHGDVTSYDGIVNDQGEILFETSHVYTSSIMDAVNEHQGIGCYSRLTIPEDLKQAGRKTVAAFNTRSRFFHFEFFILKEDQAGVGKKGEILGLEVNMRPPGSFLPDLINYANDFNIYQLWADMIVHNHSSITTQRPYSAVFIGRKDCVAYQYSLAEIREIFQASIIDIRRLPSVLSAAMGDVVVLARFKSIPEVERFVTLCSATVNS